MYEVFKITNGKVSRFFLLKTNAEANKKRNDKIEVVKMPEKEYREKNESGLFEDAEVKEKQTKKKEKVKKSDNEEITKLLKEMQEEIRQLKEENAKIKKAKSKNYEYLKQLDGERNQLSERIRILDEGEKDTLEILKEIENTADFDEVYYVSKIVSNDRHSENPSVSFSKTFYVKGHAEYTLKIIKEKKEEIKKRIAEIDKEFA